MKIDRLILGAYETNCYVLRSSEAVQDCLIIDAGPGADKLIKFLQEHNLNPVALVLTHGHIDHIEGVAALRAEFPDIKVYIHKLDAEMLTEPHTNLSAMTGAAFSVEPADFFLEEQSVIEQAEIKLSVLHTPGHTPGGICLYCEDEGIVFTDDALFADSIGRTDFPNGNTEHLLQSIREKLFTLPDETKVYPGHGPVTTIAHEREYNPFLR
ncbi:MAG: MBL fold metallo-hydrolase [Planctomycetes bacterium]|nr:MBL fold metallo-hydrolase [Planctomycetota bacterium]MBL7144075.1 MBL fold metallo-hydrolase [Phycisphaerae bacterium]